MARISENDEERQVEVPKEPIFDPEQVPTKEPSPVEAPIEAPVPEKVDA